jgi:nitrous oxidase accessory protein NosD
VQIASPTATDNQVQGNLIGTDVTGTADLGNSSDGVHLERNVSKNEVAGNTISGNGSGVEIFGAEDKGNETWATLLART